MHWADTFIGAGGFATVLAVLSPFAKRLVVSVIKDIVQVAVKDVGAEVKALALKVASETGGNSNGLRQKLNEVGQDVAELKGAFAEHTKVSK